MTSIKHTSIFLFLSTLLLISACGGGSGAAFIEDTNDTNDVDVSTFNGVWYSPCFNNSHDFSARQKLTINSTSLISQLDSHADAPAKTPDCELSAGRFIAADITATLGFGSNSEESSCVDGMGVESTISLISNQSSGVLINTQPDLTNSIELLTGRKDDFLPASSVICLKPNGNLLFAGYEYTSASNTEIVDDDTSTVVTPSNKAVTWKVGSYSYVGGSASGSSASGTSCIGDSCPGSDNFGSLAMGTSGFDMSNGDYSGSGITISHTLKGVGTYSLGNDSLYVGEDDFSHNRVELSVVVGTATSDGATGYEATSGNVAVTVDSDGKYHFTIAPPIQLTKAADVLGGVPNAPATISFSMNNIHDHNP